MTPHFKVCTPVLLKQFSDKAVFFAKFTASFFASIYVLLADYLQQFGICFLKNQKKPSQDNWDNLFLVVVSKGY